MLKVSEMTEEQFVENFSYTSDTLLMDPETSFIDTAKNWVLYYEMRLIKAKKHFNGWKSTLEKWDNLKHVDVTGNEI
jgi:hypothetical protein